MIHARAGSLELIGRGGWVDWQGDADVNIEILQCDDSGATEETFHLLGLSTFQFLYGHQINWQVLKMG